MALVAATRIYQVVQYTSRLTTYVWVTYKVAQFIKDHYLHQHQHTHQNESSLPEGEIIQLVARRRARTNRPNNSTTSDTLHDESETIHDESDTIHDDSDVQIIAEVPASKPNLHDGSEKQIFLSSEPDVVLSSETVVAGPSNYNPPSASGVVDTTAAVVDEARDISILSETETSVESPIVGDEAIRYIQVECFICARPLHIANKSVATLPFCRHTFHMKCVESMLKFHQKCPICDCHVFTPL